MYTELEEFQEIPAGTVFRVVTTEFHYEDYNGALTFVCVKGGSPHHDWAIYYGPSIWGADRVKNNGEKLMNELKITSIFPCDKEVLNLYRF